MFHVKHRVFNAARRISGGWREAVGEERRTDGGAAWVQSVVRGEAELLQMAVRRGVQSVVRGEAELLQVAGGEV